MECEKHKGRDMDLVYSEPSVCPACQNPSPPVLIGYTCTLDGSKYDLKGVLVVEEAVAEVAEVKPPPAPSPLAPKVEDEDLPPVEEPFVAERKSRYDKKN